MTLKCNGCGSEIEDLGGVFGFGQVARPFTYDHPSLPRDREIGVAENMKTLCPKCTRVIKEILLNSDLSDHWTNETE